MVRRKFDPSISLWKQHANLYEKVFKSALSILARGDLISGDENAISESLYPILSQVCYDFYSEGGFDIPTPQWETPIPPTSIDELKGGKNNKRPDFQCKRRNQNAKSGEDYELSLHVECKRLGKKTSSSHYLNKNYVTKGIKRFDSKSHEYGKRAHSGIMIGYIISMTPKTILEKINQYQKKHLTNNPNIKFAHLNSSVIETRQKLQRNHVKPKKFQLVHLWVDIRNNYIP